MPDWSQMFTLDTPPLEIMLRGVITYLALLVMLRMVGQRESGGLGLTDVLIVVLIAQAAAGGLTGDSNSLTDGILLVATILLCSLAVDAAAYRWPRIAVALKARPRPLIEDGRLNQKLMRREFMTHEEVLSQLRLHGIEDLHQVRRAYLEPSGMISVLRYDVQEADDPPPPPAIR